MKQLVKKFGTNYEDCKFYKDDRPEEDSKFMYELGRWYSVTINPNDKLQHFDDPKRDTKEINRLNELLLAYTRMEIQYYFRMEFSMPIRPRYECKGSRIHWHGYMRFNSWAGLRQWLLIHNYRLLLHCMVEIDTIKDFDIWKAYCNKQSGLHLKVLENCLLPDNSYDNID